MAFQPSSTKCFAGSFFVSGPKLIFSSTSSAIFFLTLFYFSFHISDFYLFRGPRVNVFSLCPLLSKTCSMMFLPFSSDNYFLFFLSNFFLIVPHPTSINQPLFFFVQIVLCVIIYSAIYSLLHFHFDSLIFFPLSFLFSLMLSSYLTFPSLFSFLVELNIPPYPFLAPRPSCSKAFMCHYVQKAENMVSLLSFSITLLLVQLHLLQPPFICTVL